MCGIVGFMNKTNGRPESLGQTMVAMLRALGCRGPDSAGVALFGTPVDGWILQIKLPESGDVDTAALAVQAVAARSAPVLDVRVTGPYSRLVVGETADPLQLERAIESAACGIELISMGQCLEILKQVGS